MTVQPTSLSVWRFPVPWNQMVELGLLSVADGFDDVGEPGLRVDVVEFSGFNQGVDDGRVIAGPVIAKKQIIFPPQDYVFDGAF